MNFNLKQINMQKLFITLALTIICLSMNAQTAYIADWGTSTVTVVNVATGKVTDTINVGGYPTGVSVSPDGNKVYVANWGDGTISVISTAADTVLATIPVTGFPEGVDVSPNGKKLYVVNNDGSGIVSVINTTTYLVIDTIAAGAEYSEGIAVSTDGSKVYVADYQNNTVNVIDTLTNTVSATIPVSNEPFGIAVSPDGKKVYVANSSENLVSVINTANNTGIDTIEVGSYPMGLTVSPDGSKVYVANNGTNPSVSVISTSTETVTATISIVTSGGEPYALSVSPDGAKLYVTNIGGGTDSTVTIINTATNTISSEISVDGYPYSLGNFISKHTYTAGIAPLSLLSANMDVYPNPASNNLTVESAVNGVIDIINIQGQLIQTLPTSRNKTNIDISSYPSGVYFLEIRTDKGLEVKKFVKE